MTSLRALPAVALLLLGPLPATAQNGATATNSATDNRGSNPIAVIGALNKREGTTADFTLKPGEQFHFGTLTGTLRTCETTAPYEVKQSAAFVQVVEKPKAMRRQAEPRAVTVFSGWLFAESPSLNPFIHPVYDVWLKSCTMDFPEGPSAPAARPARSAAARSAAPAAEAPAEAPAD